MIFFFYIKTIILLKLLLNLEIFINKLVWNNIIEIRLYNLNITYFLIFLIIIVITIFCKIIIYKKSINTLFICFKISLRLKTVYKSQSQFIAHYIKDYIIFFSYKVDKKICLLLDYLLINK